MKAKFGRKKRRGVKPPVFVKAGGKVIREVVKQLKEIGYVDSYCSKDGNLFGLNLTKTGTSELDKIATKIVKEIRK